MECFQVSLMPSMPGNLPSSTYSSPTAVTQHDSAKLIVVGSAAVDITAQATLMPNTDPNHGSRSTTSGTVSVSLGGVGRNVAEAAHRIITSLRPDIPAAVALVSCVGDDSFGRLLVDETAKIGMRTDGLFTVHAQRSAVCNMVLDSAGS